MSEFDKEFEYATTDQGFAAFLCTRFMFMGAIDTGQKMGKGQYGNRKAFEFLVPTGTDMDQLKVDYELGTDATKVPFHVAFNKMRLIRQSCKKPFNTAGATQ